MVDIERLFEINRVNCEYSLSKGDMTIDEFLDRICSSPLFYQFYPEKKDRNKFKKKLLKIAHKHYLNEYQKRQSELRKYMYLKVQFSNELKNKRWQE